ncbi:MAG: hypothetical protein ICV51_16530, partial [Flavisolibacter sp.]|nr:hypothetical protein [Flavisolibacter sp.]
EKNGGKFIRTLYPVSPSGNNIYNHQWYAGGMIRADINTKNSKALPTRGIELNAYAKRLAELNNSNDFTEVGGYLSWYTDALWKKHIVLATSFGAAHNFGTFAFQQAQYLGLRQNLRGYRIQRFAGHSKAYNNTELRIKLCTLNLHLFKGSFGMMGFHDIGRVWSDGEKSTTWHRGYGGGLWLAPFDKLVLSAAMTYSKEEKNLGIINFGFQF